MSRDQDEWVGSTLQRDSDGTHAVELPRLAGTLPFRERYRRERLLGEGGMGTVTLYTDRQIGRRIAMKVIRGDHAAEASAAARFVREAMVQGQLEHPSIVPVYDLGVDPDGATYFTMKRVRGVTLAEIVSRSSFGEPAGQSPRRRLLSAFSNVCLTIDFAHRHGVIHRDLKPGNIMLGDFGEVYVLDWGLAKLKGAADPDGSTEHVLPESVLAQTQQGALLGTPGFMAPEQVRGEHDRAGPAADVYSLGAVLFELLTQRPLHPGRTTAELLRSTLDGVEARPSVRTPELDVPVELEQIVVKATALDPAARYPSARALHDDLERFLDGERDLERRAEQANAHVRAAEELLVRAASERDPKFPHRRQAMREIGRALALDPSNAKAMSAMVALLSSPPTETPADVKESMARSASQQVRTMARIGGVTYLTMFAYLPFFLWCGVRDWRWIGAFCALAAATSIVSLITLKRSRPTDRSVLLVMILSNAMLACSAGLYGPLVITPGILAVNTMAFALHLRDRYRVYAIITGSGTMVVLVALALAGLLPGGYRFGPDGMTLLPGAIGMSALPTTVFLAVLSVATVFTAAAPITRVRDAMFSLEQRLQVYSWHLREMLPEAIRAPTDPTSTQNSRR